MGADVLKTGLRAILWIKCPACGETEEVEFDNDDLDGLAHVTADCEDCGHEMLVNLEAFVQHTAPKVPAP